MTDLFAIRGKINIDTGNVDQAEARVEQLAQLSSKGRPLHLDTRQAVTQVNQLERLHNEMARRMGVAPRLRVDTSGSVTTIKALESQVDQLQKKLAATKMPTAAGGRLGGLGSEVGNLGAGLLGSAIGGYSAERLIESSLSNAAFTRRMEASVMQGFGGQGPSVIKFINDLSASTSYLAADLMQSIAVIDGATAANGLNAESMQQLTKLATGIAATSALPEYMDNVQSSSEALVRGLNGQDKGLKLLGIRTNDDYMKTEYLNGALAKNWDAMDGAAKMQERYNAIMAETQRIINGAVDGGDEYTRSVREAKKAFDEAKWALGEKLIPVVERLAKLVKSLPTPVLEAGIGGMAAAGLAPGAYSATRLAQMGFRALGSDGAVAGGAAAAQAVGAAAAGAAAAESGAAVGVSAAAGAAGAMAALAVPAAIAAVAAAGAYGVKQSIESGKADYYQNTATRLLHTQGTLDWMQYQAETARGGSPLQLAKPAIWAAKALGIMPDSERLIDERDRAKGTASKYNTALAQQAWAAQVESGNQFMFTEGDMSRAATRDEAIAALMAAQSRDALGYAVTAAPPPVQVKVEIVNRSGETIEALPPVTNAGSYAPSSQ